MNLAQQMPDGERMLRLGDVAAFLNVSVKTVRRLIINGQLPSKKLGGLRFVRWSDFQRLVQTPVQS